MTRCSGHPDKNTRIYKKERNTYMVMVTDFRILRNDCRTLHDADGFLVVFMSQLHLSPFAPHLSKVLDSSEVDFCCTFQNFSSAFQVPFCLACGASFLIELGKVDEKTV